MIKTKPINVMIDENILFDMIPDLWRWSFIENEKPSNDPGAFLSVLVIHDKKVKPAIYYGLSKKFWLWGRHENSIDAQYWTHFPNYPEGIIENER